MGRLPRRRPPADARAGASWCPIRSRFSSWASEGRRRGLMQRLSDRQSAVVLGVALLISYAYFYQAGGWNQNSRFDLVRALTEHRTLRIDGYDQNTGDKAVVNGHVYSDKAPGQ